MILNSLFTPESLALLNERRQEAALLYQEQVEAFKHDFHLTLETVSEFEPWFQAFNNANLAGMLDYPLARLLAEKLAEDVPAKGTRDALSLKQVYSFILPKLCDIKRDLDENIQRIWAGVELTLDVAVLRRAAALPDGEFAKIRTPDGARDVSIVDLHLYEIIPEVVDARLDDREKVHIKYLTWTDADGTTKSDVIYIGVGTGEPYGSGFAQADKRPRVYELDLFDLFRATRWTHCLIDTWRSADLREASAREHITAERAEIVHGVDPISGEALFLGYLGILQLMEAYLKNGAVTDYEFRQVVMQRHRYEDLDDPDHLRDFKQTEQRPLEQVIQETAEVYPYYVAAFFLPLRILLQHDDEEQEDGTRLRRYYLRLPSFRREQYELLRFRPDVLAECGIDDVDVTVPGLLSNAHARIALQEKHPDDYKRLNAWLQYSVAKDLEEYGTPPYSRLVASLFLVALLHQTRAWDGLIKAAHEGKLYELDVSLRALTDAV